MRVIVLVVVVTGGKQSQLLVLSLSLKFDNRKRKHDVLWFNPPYNSTVSTNIGREFLKLIDECFHKGHKLRKAFNRHTVKISYSTTPNMQQIISAKKQQNTKRKLTRDQKMQLHPKQERKMSPSE